MSPRNIGPSKQNPQFELRSQSESERERNGDGKASSSLAYLERLCAAASYCGFDGSLISSVCHGAAVVQLFRERKDKADMGQGCRSWCDCAILPTWSSVVAAGSR
ncbi:hypothetical protein WN944_014843 [Citrus x changshan-huyou]|uniref:Uncharacterized protein n=1 Tax=Citrus x changshan-huyou TaxID=2935761 RepID=A0AAP0M6E7_9ROSI